MKKSGMTFLEGVKVSWKRELEIGDPQRILQLARGTVIYTFAHVLFVVIPNALLAAGKRWKEKDDKKNSH